MNRVTDVVPTASPGTSCWVWWLRWKPNPEHPLAAAIVRYATEQGVTAPALTGFRNVPGHGATATVAARRVAVGNRKLMVGEDVDFRCR